MSSSYNKSSTNKCTRTFIINISKETPFIKICYDFTTHDLISVTGIKETSIESSIEITKSFKAFTTKIFKFIIGRGAYIWSCFTHEEFIVAWKTSFNLNTGKRIITFSTSVLISQFECSQLLICWFDIIVFMISGHFLSSRSQPSRVCSDIGEYTS